MPRKVRFPVRARRVAVSRQPSGFGQLGARGSRPPPRSGSWPADRSSTARSGGRPCGRVGRVTVAAPTRRGRPLARSRSTRPRSSSSSGRGRRAHEVVGRVLARDARHVELQADRPRLAAALAQVGRRPRPSPSSPRRAGGRRCRARARCGRCRACRGRRWPESLKKAGGRLRGGRRREDAREHEQHDEPPHRSAREVAAAARDLVAVARAPGCHGSRSGSVS